MSAWSFSKVEEGILLSGDTNRKVDSNETTKVVGKQGIDGINQK